MTIKELREALALLTVKDDAKQLVVWLPGSRIDLCSKLMIRDVPGCDEVLIEGNVRPGSALEVL